jgi:hypothetical protein
VVLLLCVAWMPAAHASSLRGQSINDMRQIVLAVQHYQEIYGKMPADSYDARGRPLLSWRVHILPFLDYDHLYKQFHFDEPWDSPHNRQLIGQIPRTFRDIGGGEQGAGLTCCLRPTGERTAFPPGRPEVTETVLAGRRPCAIVVEAEDEYAVVWTRPADLPCDPTRPGAGLARRWQEYFFPERMALAALADGQVRLVSPDDPDTVRSLLSPEGEEGERVLPWYASFARLPWTRVTVPSLLFGLVAVAGALRAISRLRWEEPISPGEFLWLIVGVNQLVYWVVPVLFYRVELAPPAHGRGGQDLLLWFMPTLAGAVAATLPLALYRFSFEWTLFFGINLAVWVLMALDALTPGRNRWPAESLLTVTPSILLGLVAVMAATLTAWGVVYPGPSRSRWAHWTGMLVYAFPAAWFAWQAAQGLVELHPPFLRILD